MEDTLEIVDHMDGTYGVTYVASGSGSMLVHVAIQVTPISSSPFLVKLLPLEGEDHEGRKATGADAPDGPGGPCAGDSGPLSGTPSGAS